ncbi:lysozyme inhibitor LprI family protein [Pseudoduganella sp. UC29_106]|uniref:lysozyme inhibitor LprI family protein n=1 Tax=Pseudoduganella sp. UC29_106 TaxID=3374553 RepID=UPI003756A423
MDNKFLIGLICLSVTIPAMGQASREIIEGCWAEGAHPVMAVCVERYARATELVLAKTENATLAKFSMSADNSASRAKVKKALLSSSQTFRAYRLAECRFRDVVASSGNASESLKLACEAELNEARIARLNELSQ